MSGITNIPDFATRVLSLKEYGAVGDGVVDDTAAVQAWLNAINTSGRDGYAPTGIYLLTSQVSITLGTDRAIRIVGAGGPPHPTTADTGTQFLLGASLLNNDTPAILITGSFQSSFVSLERFAVINLGSFTGSGLKVHQVSRRVTIDRVRCRGFNGTGARGLWINECIGVNGIGVYCDANYIGCEHGGVTSIGEGFFIGSKFTANTLVQFKCGAGSSFLHLAGNTYFGADTAGGILLANGVFCISITDSNFENATPSIYQADVGNGATELTIERNSLQPRNVTGAGTKYGLDLIGTIRNSRIQNNIVSLNATAGGTVIGIRIGTSTDNIIAPNRFSLNGGGGTETLFSIPAEQVTTDTGTQNNFDIVRRELLPNTYYLRCNNATALTITGFTVGGSTPRQGDRVVIDNVASSTVKVTHQDTGSTAANRVITASTNGQIIGANGRMEMIYDATSARWRLSVVDPGAPIAVAHAAGNFTGNNSMTWTVASGDQTVFSYQQRGKLLTLIVRITNTSVGGTPSTQLLIAMPDGFSSTANMEMLGYAGDNGTGITVRVNILTTSIRILRTAGGNWSAATDATDVAFSLALEVD